MSPPLRCTPRYETPVAVLHTTGSLTLETAAQLRGALLKCLTDQPSAVLIDAAALTVGDDIALTAFGAAARYAAAWPAIPLLVCAPSPQVADGLRRLGIDRHIAICADLDQGREVAANRRLPVQVRSQLSAVLASARAARELVSAACQRWRLTDLGGPASLVVTELVTNVVRHAGTPMDLIVTRSRRYVHIAVRDYDHRRARLTGPDGETEPGGRGLILVAAVATSWGCTPLYDGKVTWASLRQGVPDGAAAGRV